MIPSIAVLGLPEAGKSSFIAALSHLLQFREVPTVLTLARLSAEDKYLFEMRSAWQNCKPFGRTGGGPVHPINLHLLTARSSQVDVFFPDVVGEEFEEQWRGREWSAEFTEAVSSSSALLLFINARTLAKPVSKVDVANAEIEILKAIGVDAEDIEGVDIPVTRVTEIKPDASTNAGEAIVREVATQGAEGVIAIHDPKIWNPRNADAQVKIVDILQELASFGENKFWKLGVIISAWDIVKKQMEVVSPSEWLEKECPFVSQYLASNPGSFDPKVFGVSAQGGDPAEDGDKLRAYDSQSERVHLVYDGYEGHDLTRVLAWAVGDHEL